MRYPCLCFDLDGTIMKTDEGIVLSLRYAAETLGVAGVPYDRHDLFIGPSNVSFARGVLGLDEATAIEFDRLMVEKYHRIHIEHSQVFDGMLALLQDCAAAGYRNFVCTAKNESAAKQLGAHYAFGAHVDGIYGALGGSDEKAQILQRLIDAEKLAPEQIAMIGDRFTDLDGGRACGTHTVGVLYGYGLRSELEACQPDAILETVEDLRHFLLES